MVRTACCRVVLMFVLHTLVHIMYAVLSRSAWCLSLYLVYLVISNCGLRSLGTAGAGQQPPTHTRTPTHARPPAPPAHPPTPTPAHPPPHPPAHPPVHPPAHPPTHPHMVDHKSAVSRRPVQPAPLPLHLPLCRLDFRLTPVRDMSALLKCPKMATGRVLVNNQLEVLEQCKRLKTAFPGMPRSCQGGPVGGAEVYAGVCGGASCMQREGGSSAQRECGARAQSKYVLLTPS